MQRILVICLMLLFFSGSISAQETRSPRSPVDIGQEKLGGKEPQLYKERQEALESQAKISVIVTAFRKGKISRYYAESQLNPLVKQEIEDDINKLESKIASLEKELALLKEAKTNPEPLIKKRIDQMLDKTMLTPDELMKKSPAALPPH